jgi:Fic family protein
MTLNYQKLIAFDLVNDLEEKLAENLDKFLEFFNVYQQIQSVDDFIRGCPSFPDSTKKIVRDELMFAIGSTLAIEGIKLKEEEIRETLQQPENIKLQDKLQRKQQEVLNSEKVYAYVQDVVNKCGGQFVYEEEHIKTIHRLFTENIEYPGNQPGTYRNTAVLFGEPRKYSLCEDWTQVNKAMGNFVKWLNQDTKGPLSGNTITKAVMAHYYFTEIHPFGDGNGRSARAIEAMVLYANKINIYCFWSLANFWSARRNEYIARLSEMRDTCNPMDFLIWGARGYLEEIQRVKARVLKKLTQLMFRDYVRYLFDEKNRRKPEERINTTIRRLVELLTNSGKIRLDKFRSSPEYKSLYFHRSAASESRDLSKMKRLELICVSTENGREFIEPNYKILDSLRYTV